MNIFKILYEEIVSFFGFGPFMEMFQTGDYSSLLTAKGLLTAIWPIIPLLVIIEIIRAAVHKKLRFSEYKVITLIYVFNRFVSRLISITLVAFCIGLFTEYAILKTSLTWYWFIYGYIVWELAHFIYHYLAHKVRFFWCLHSTHHALENMNLSVAYAHFFLEAPYADIIRTTICILLGVNPELLLLIMIIDGTWGSFIHVGENIMKSGRLGFLNKIILTPLHHRLHHARNPVYMDTNFCNLLNIWDRIFKTYAEQREDIPIEYGITRQINPNNFFDVYFGEIAALWKDIRKARGIKNKFLYFVMPPGWSHTGNHRTAKIVRKEFFENDSLNKNLVAPQMQYYKTVQKSESPEV